MFDRFSSIPKVLIRSCLVFFVLIASACTSPAIASTQSPYSTCLSPSTNPYRLSLLSSQVTNIFASYKNNSINLDSARQDAFSQLAKSVEQWSDYKDVDIDGQRTIRVVITYLDPMLVQYILLNHALTPPNNLLDQTWFSNQIQTAMNDLAKRGEIIFIVTVTSSSYEGAPKITIPIKRLKLINASDRDILLTHNDPILGKEIDITRGPIFGFVGYPVSVLVDNVCTDVMDQWTTSFELEFEPLPKDENPFIPLSWSIPYRPLVTLQDNNYITSTPEHSSGFNRFSKSDAPPTPATEINKTDWKIYWEEMGRYIWSKVMNSKH